MNFVLVHLMQPGHVHGNAFNEVVRTIEWGLRELGHGVVHSRTFKWTVAWQATDVRPIVFGAHLHSTELHGEIPDNAIIYNLEHPFSEYTAHLMKKLSDKHVVWDYSRTNLLRWSIVHRLVQHVPISYSPWLTNIDRAPEAQRDIDVLFYGWMNDRRHKVIDELRSVKNLNVVHVDNVYGAERDALMARAKVVLNVHFYLPAELEIVRVSHCWANRIAVVTEDSSGLTDTDRMSMVTVDYKDLAAACCGLVQLAGVRQELEDVAFMEFRKQDIRPVLEAAVRQLNLL